MINVIPIKAYKIIRKEDDLCGAIIDSVKYEGQELHEKDVVIVSSKVTALTEKRQESLENIASGDYAKKLSAKYFIDDRLAELVLRESDKVLGGVKGVLLTIIYNNLIANAGIDKSNSEGNNNVILWPINPYESAKNIRAGLTRNYCLKDLGLIISDSHITPLRQGVVGSAIGVAGMHSVENCIGRTDLFGRKMQYTKRAIADQLVSAAHLVMGECDERTPFAVIRGISQGFTDEEISMEETYMKFNECLFMNSIREYFS